MEKFTYMSKLFPMCEKMFAYETWSSHAWTNFTCTRLFHMCKKFHTQDKTVSHGKDFTWTEKNCFTCVKTFHIHYKIVSHMWKKNSHEKNFTSKEKLFRYSAVFLKWLFRTQNCFVRWASSLSDDICLTYKLRMDQASINIWGK